MKQLFILVYSYFNKIIIRIILPITIEKTLLFQVRVKVNKHNLISFFKTTIKKSSFSIEGLNNVVEIKAEHITNSKISIQGDNNKIIFSNGVGMSNSDIIIRGSNCLIQIGVHSTFGGIRIVNIGCNNSIVIGENCLFSDKIEVWASDSHSIFDEKGFMINKEKPITIQDNVWVGSNVTILKGVVIGEGSVIGMSSVVTKSVNPFSINVGNPAKSVKSNIKWSLEYNLKN
jgi:acetyltransferase-like isoleucine patch superfamily enzyme